MSTSATVTLTLKSKPKIQPPQTTPRSSGSAVKLKLTKTNGQAATPGAGSPAQAATVTPSASNAAPSLSVPASATTPTTERKSPPKTGTGVTPKLVRKASLSSPAQSATASNERTDEGIAPPPRAKVLSRFPLKRNSFDKSAFGVELRSVRDRSTFFSKEVKKQESKCNGDASSTQSEQQQQQQLPEPNSQVAKSETDSAPVMQVTNGVVSHESSTTVGLQTNGRRATSKEQAKTSITENGQSVFKNSQENITAKMSSTSIVEGSKKTVLGRKSLLQKSVKKKSPTSADRLTTTQSEEVTSVAAVLPPDPAISNGTNKKQAPVRSTIIADAAGHEKQASASVATSSNCGTKLMKNLTKLATAGAIASVEEEKESTKSSRMPSPPMGSAEADSSLVSTISEERISVDDIEEASSSSTLTPAPSEERELVQNNAIETMTSTTDMVTTTITTMSTSATLIGSATASSSGKSFQARPNVHTSSTNNSKSQPSDFDNASSNSVPVVDGCPVAASPETSDADEVTAAVEASSAPIAASIESASPLLRAEAKTPHLINSSLDVTSCVSMANVAAAELTTTGTSAVTERRMSAETGAIPKDTTATRLSKAESSSGGANTIEKESVVRNMKNATTTAIGKTLQKPLNIAQKIIEAALQKSPSGAVSQTPSLVRNTQPMPSMGYSATASQVTAGTIIPFLYAGSQTDRTQPFAPGGQSQPLSRPSSVMANIQTVDIRNLGRLLRSPTPRPLSVLDGVDPRETELKDAFTDTASSSGVSCSLSAHSLATTIAQSRSTSPESLLSISAAPSRHGSKKVEHYELGSSQGQAGQQKFETFEHKQNRLEADLKEAQYSLGRERAQILQLQEELHQMRQERNEAQQRLEAAIADAVRKEKLAHRLQRELSETSAHEDTAEIEVGILKRHQTHLEEVMSSQKEDLEDLQSQLHMLREQNKHLEDQIKKQADRSTQDIQHKDRELEQLKTAAQKEVAHYQQLLKECQDQRRELLRKNTELQDNRQDLIEKVHELGDQAGIEKRLKRCLYRTLVLLRDARVTIEHMRVTQPTRTQISKLRQKAEEADQLKEIAERAKESAVAQGEQLEQALEQVVQTRHFLQTRVDKLSHENKLLQSQVDDLVLENAELDNRYKKQVSINSSEQESREESATKIVKLEAQVETLESRLQQLRFEKQVEEDSRVNSVLNSFETRTNQLELKLETEKLDKHKLQGQFNRLSDQMENARRELDAAQKREASLQITTTNQQRCLLDMRRELAEARDRNCQMRMERQTLDSQLEELIEEVRHLQTCLRVANQRIRDLEIALETTDPIQIENIMESIIEDSNSDDYEDADAGDQGLS
ncbi:mucin-19-like isoform X1 [Varroa jacobsoni]|uniref:mucin-19-like isoform X1 n=1 Tax=Varroa jacobsoni TaxID=62625 RepID=UPI000BF67D44|nr:mucin-19-like isoform X1 [Varroa jacobsoni]